MSAERGDDLMAKLRYPNPIDAVRMLVALGDPDPRMLQVAFAGFVSADFVIRGVGGMDVELTGIPGLGLVLTAVTTLLAFVVPWGRLSPQAVTVIPVLDIAALGAVRVTQEGSAAGILIVVPALWLGRQLGRRGAVVSVVAVAALASAPSMVILGTHALEVARAVLITIVAGWSALAIAFSLERIRGERDEAERRGSELAEAMATIEQHQRTAQAIFDAVDVGLVLLDHEGRFRAQPAPGGLLRAGLPRRARRSRRAGGARVQRGRPHPAGARRDADVPRRPGRGVRGPPGLGGLRPADPSGAGGLGAGAARAGRRLRGGGHGLHRRHRAAPGHGGQGGLRGAGVPRAADPARLDHGVRRDAAGAPRPAVRGREAARGRQPQRPAAAAADRRPAAQRAAERGRDLILERRRCDLVQVVRHAVEGATPTVRAAALSLRTDLPDELWLMGDPQRLGQLVDNPLSNAVKYTPGGGQVTLSLTLDGSRAELAVSDTGIGIAAADRDRLFTRFFRGDTAQRQAIPGVGLGLSIAQSIVESHGGRIEVESEHGAGTTFRVRLPVGA